MAWDTRSAHPKHLRLDRIDKATPGGTGTLLPGERDQLTRAATYQIGGWAGREEPFPVCVRVSGENWVQAFLEQPPALPEAKVELQADGTALVTFKATELRGPARWVLQMGPDAEVLSPVEFRDYVGKRAEETAGRYRTGKAGKTRP